MDEQIKKIQAVINTLNELDIQSKQGTMMKILGCMTVLAEVRDALNAPKGVEPDADNPNE